MAATRATMLLGCYRKGDANDPDTYVAAIAAILSEYSVEVVQHVTDPRTGIARKSTFMPSIPEVDKACMEHAKFCADRDTLIRRGWVMRDGKWVKAA